MESNTDGGNVAEKSPEELAREWAYLQLARVQGDEYMYSARNALESGFMAGFSAGEQRARDRARPLIQAAHDSGYAIAVQALRSPECEVHRWDLDCNGQLDGEDYADWLKQKAKK